ncbi:hypothetical protein [Speluncibacter jeojiensis]|uniref:Uncharacterized protein n=1 Tax=Speluncibacter jeojiensis TaxID=2710754 RepID=A0A9X4RG82_9ACTN|nr:hypothetical protein [Rhodococcus sp. D2-41]MDG3017062.1 hypothetical protein [Corynebacteriales bacterium D3-21]
MVSERVISDNDLRKAIRELRARQDLARKEGHADLVDDLARRIRSYQDEMGRRL